MQDIEVYEWSYIQIWSSLDIVVMQNYVMFVCVCLCVCVCVCVWGGGGGGFVFNLNMLLKKKFNQQLLKIQWLLCVTTVMVCYNDMLFLILIDMGWGWWFGFGVLCF